MIPSPVVERLYVAAATASNRRHRNDDAIGFDGWVLGGEDVNPLRMIRRLRRDRSVAIAVTDGMSIAPDGDLAARLAALTLTDRRYATDPTEQTVVDVFDRANAAITKSSHDDNRGMGCAAALVVVRPDGIALIGNVGDVRIYWTVDGYLGQLTEDDRRDSSGKLSRCLGGRIPTSVVPHPHHIQVRPGDRLLMCTDGLHDAVDPGDIEKCLEMEVEYGVAELVRTAKASDRSDGGNITAVVIEIGRSPQTDIRSASPNPVQAASPVVAPPAVGGADSHAAPTQPREAHHRPPQGHPQPPPPEDAPKGVGKSLVSGVKRALGFGPEDDPNGRRE